MDRSPSFPGATVDRKRGLAWSRAPRPRVPSAHRVVVEEHQRLDPAARADRRRPRGSGAPIRPCLCTRPAVLRVVDEGRSRPRRASSARGRRTKCSVSVAYDALPSCSTRYATTPPGWLPLPTPDARRADVEGLAELSPRVPMRAPTSSKRTGEVGRAHHLALGIPADIATPFHTDDRGLIVAHVDGNEERGPGGDPSGGAEDGVMRAIGPSARPRLMRRIWLPSEAEAGPSRRGRCISSSESKPTQLVLPPTSAVSRPGDAMLPRTPQNESSGEALLLGRCHPNFGISRMRSPIAGVTVHQNGSSSTLSRMVCLSCSSCSSRVLVCRRLCRTSAWLLVRRFKSVGLECRGRLRRRGKARHDPTTIDLAVLGFDLGDGCGNEIAEHLVTTGRTSACFFTTSTKRRAGARPPTDASSQKPDQADDSSGGCSAGPGALRTAQDEAAIEIRHDADDADVRPGVAPDAAQHRHVAARDGHVSDRQPACGMAPSPDEPVLLPKPMPMSSAVVFGGSSTKVPWPFRVCL